MIISTTEYKQWLNDLKTKIKQSQLKASLAINAELILLYWDIGKQIVEKQEKAKWGSGLVDQLSKDLKSEFPDITGFSKSNLYSSKQFYLTFNQDVVIFHQAGGKLENESQIPEIIENYCKRIPWRHIVLLLQKVKEKEQIIFYLSQIIENNWSRAVLEYQIETNLYKRQGKAITNFKNTLPQIESDLAQQLLKDPYNFEFLTLSAKAKEAELEQKLVQNITQFLLELGKGFAYLGRQYPIVVGKKEYRTDLLFYHIKLRSYVIIELKMTEFEPEFIGKLNFYISAVNEFIKSPADNNTIGILLCKNKDDYEVEFALKDVNKPIGVSEFKYTELPEEIKQALPSIDEFKNELNKTED